MEERAKLILEDRQKTLEELKIRLQEYEAQIVSLESEKSSANNQEISDITAQIDIVKMERKSIKRKISSTQRKIEEDNKLVETFENYEIELEEKTKELNSIRVHKKTYSRKQNDEIDKKIQNRISRLEKDVFNCSNRIRSYKNSGAYQQEALESKMYYELIGEIAKLKKVTRNEYREELLEKEITYIKSEMKKISIHFTKSRLSTEIEKGESNKRTITGRKGTKGKANNDLPENENKNMEENRGEIIYMEELRIEIARLEEEVRRSREREASYRDTVLGIDSSNTAEDRNDSRALAEQNIEREESERNVLMQRISDMQRLDRQIEASARRMEDARNSGAYDQEAGEHSYYNQLVEQAQRLINLNPNQTRNISNEDRANENNTGAVSERIINETRNEDGTITREIEVEVEKLEQVSRVIEEANASITQMYIQREIERLAKERGRKPEDYTTGPVTPGGDTERDGYGDDNPLNYIGIFEKNKKKEIIKKKFKEIEKEVEVEEEVEKLEEVDRVIEEPNAAITQIYIQKAIEKAAKERGLKPEDFTTGPVTSGDDTQRDGYGDDNPLNYIGIFLKTKQLQKVKKMVKELEEIPEDKKPEPTPEPTPEPVPPTPTPVPDRTIPEPNNLPLTSGLQIYRQVLNEIGPIKGTRAIKAHNWCKDHLRFFGIGPLAAAIIRGVTGRKKEIKRIEGILDDLTLDDKGNPDYSKLDLMMDDFLTRDNSTKNIIKVKSNDIFLRALHNKLLRDKAERAPMYDKAVQDLWGRIISLQEQKKDADPKDLPNIEKQIANLTNSYRLVKNAGEHLTERARLVERGREEKSIDYKNNIRGADEAVRDPDNREEINRLADIDLKRLEAIRNGDAVSTLNYMAEMDRYMDEQTQFKRASLGGHKSIGQFESYACTLQDISDQKYKFVKVATGLAQGLTISAVALSRALDRAASQIDTSLDTSKVQQQLQNAQRKVDAQTQQLGQAHQDVRKLQTNVTASDVVKTKDAVYEGSLTTQTAGERSSELAGAFNEQSQAYIQNDATNVARSNSAVMNAGAYENAHTSGNPIKRIADLFKFKAQEASGRRQLMAEYGNNAGAYYNGGQNIISHAGNVDHTITSTIEANAGDINAAQGELYSIAGRVFENIGKLNVPSASKIDLAKEIDLSSLVTACKQQGIDWFPVIAAAGLGATHTIQENKKREAEREQ